MNTKMRSDMVFAAFLLSILLVIVFAGLIVFKIMFWPPCTTVGKDCVVDGWTMAGFAGTVLAVAATVLALLGAFAVAAWWTGLEERVNKLVEGRLANQQDKMDKEIKAMLDSQEKKINQQVQDMLAIQQDKMDKEIKVMLDSQEKKIGQQVQHMLDAQRKAISSIVNAQQKALLSQQFSALQTDTQKKTNQ